MPPPLSYEARLKNIEGRDKDAYDATLKVLMYPGNSDRRLTVQAALDFYRHAALAKVKLLHTLSKAKQVEEVENYLRSWKTFVSKEEVQDMLRARSRMDIASDAAFATSLHPGPDLPRDDAMLLLSGLCSRFYSAMQTQGDLDLYKHRKDLIQSYQLYVNGSPPDSIESSIPLNLQLLSLSSAGDTLNTIKVISSWATRFLKLLHTELLMSVYPDMTKKEVLEAFNEGKVPRLPDTHIAALYDRWTHSDPRTPFGERYIGLTRVARKYGQLLGFSKNVNNLDALKADVDAASLARRAPNRSRYQPQARF